MCQARAASLVLEVFGRGKRPDSAVSCKLSPSARFEASERPAFHHRPLGKGPPAFPPPNMAIAHLTCPEYRDETGYSVTIRCRYYFLTHAIAESAPEDTSLETHVFPACGLDWNIRCHMGLTKTRNMWKHLQSAPAEAMLYSMCHTVRCPPVHVSVC